MYGGEDPLGKRHHFPLDYALAQFRCNCAYHFARQTIAAQSAA